MCKWIGHANNTQRSEFNRETAGRMRDLGWQAEHEIKLTKIFGRSLDRNYGDIDVLAWSADTGRVLIMECKDLQYLKTIGEVAEQLSDFQGHVRADGKPDHLKRHLNRLELLENDEQAVSKALRLVAPIKIEGHVVFKHPVPMKFAWERAASKVRLTLFEELETL